MEGYIGLNGWRSEVGYEVGELKEGKRADDDEHRAREGTRSGRGRCC